MLDVENLLSVAVQAAIAAGNKIMHHYQTDFEVEYKSDDSPLTIADKEAHQTIVSFLESTGFPILSEEGNHADYEIRKNWDTFWLIDPLDGTKEFVKKNGDFTINIALIVRNSPALGVVFVPVHKDLYWGSEKGSYTTKLEQSNSNEAVTTLFQHGKRLPLTSERKNYVIVGSRSHMNEATHKYVEILLKERHDIEFISRGSSLKFCTLAEGNADIYPRFGPTMEWDTAAGHAVAYFAGCTILNADTQQPLIYNKLNLLNPHFIARR